MRILVFSDTHGSIERMCGVIADMKPDMVLHLGDYRRDAQAAAARFPEIPFHMVDGNGDAYLSGHFDEIVEAAGRRIFMTHGHRWGVKGGYARAIAAAREQKADVLLFGHTHVAYEGYEDGLYILNPGSLTLPQGGAASFGIVDIVPGGIACIAAKPSR